MSWIDIAGIGVLGGIGFTVSLLIAELSYTSPAHLTQAKGAILLASAVACLLGARSVRHVFDPQHAGAAPLVGLHPVATLSVEPQGGGVGRAADVLGP